MTKSETNHSNNHLPYLDAARGLGILLIILSHIWEDQRPVIVLMYSFHVPMFFLISGLLMAHTNVVSRSWKRILTSRIRGLVIPYFFYELVFLAIFGLRSGFDFSSQNGSWYDSLLMKPLNVPVWFLIVLFAAELFVILILKTVRSKHVSALIFLAAFVLSFAGAGLGDRETSAVLFRILSAVGFLSLGYFSYEFLNGRTYSVPVLIITAVLTCIPALWNGKVGIYKLTFGNPVIFTVCAVLGSFLILFLLKNFRIRALELLGQHTVAILGLHIIALRILQEILGLKTDGYAGGILALVLVAVSMTIAGMVLEWIVPFTVGKRKK